MIHSNSYCFEPVHPYPCSVAGNSFLHRRIKANAMMGYDAGFGLGSPGQPLLRILQSQAPPVGRRKRMAMDFVMVLILSSAALSGGLVLWRASKVFGRPVLDLFQDLFRYDLDKLPVNDRAMNRAYQGLVRGSGQKGPAGLKQPRKHMVVLTPAEDFAYIRAFGVHDFEQQLLTYLRGYVAENADWHDSDYQEPTTIHFQLDEARKRLRPKLAEPSKSVTSVLSPESAGDATQIMKPQPSEKDTRAFTPPMGPDFVDADSRTASFSYGGRVIHLTKTGSAMTVGRTSDNDIVVDHDHFSALHLLVWSENGEWNVKPAPDALNATLLNNKVLLDVAVLRSGDQITVGRSEPLIFQHS